MKLVFIFLLILQVTADSEEFQLAKSYVKKVMSFTTMNTTEQLAEIFSDPFVWQDQVDKRYHNLSLKELLDDYLSKIGDLRYTYKLDTPTVLYTCYSKTDNKFHFAINMKHTIKEKTYQTVLIVMQIDGRYRVSHVYRYCEYGGSRQCVEDINKNRKIAEAIKTSIDCYFE